MRNFSHFTMILALLFTCSAAVIAQDSDIEVGGNEGLDELIIETFPFEIAVVANGSVIDSQKDAMLKLMRKEVLKSVKARYDLMIEQLGESCLIIVSVDVTYDKGKTVFVRDSGDKTDDGEVIWDFEVEYRMRGEITVIGTPGQIFNLTCWYGFFGHSSE